jgi:hypothetical protein
MQLSDLDIGSEKLNDPSRAFLFLDEKVFQLPNDPTDKWWKGAVDGSFAE